MEDINQLIEELGIAEHEGRTSISSYPSSSTLQKPVYAGLAANTARGFSISNSPRTTTSNTSPSSPSPSASSFQPSSQFVEFGGAFVLKGIDGFKIKKKNTEPALGVLNLDLTKQSFFWIYKGQVVHTAKYGDLHDAQHDMGNKQVVNIIFKGGLTCQMRTQMEKDAEILLSILRSISFKIPAYVPDRLKDRTVNKRANVQKISKKGSNKRIICLNHAKHYLHVYGDDSNLALPRHIIYLHSRLEFKKTAPVNIEINSTFKRINFQFSSNMERETWMQALSEAHEDPLKNMNGQNDGPPAFEQHINWGGTQPAPTYPIPRALGVSRAGPSAD